MGYRKTLAVTFTAALTAATASTTGTFTGRLSRLAAFGALTRLPLALTASAAVTASATTITAPAAIAAAPLTAVLNRLCLNRGIRLEARLGNTRNFALQQAFDIAQQFMLIHADQ